MIQNRISILLSALLMLITLFQDCDNKHPFDYQVQPKLPYSFNHLDLSLDINPEKNIVRGVAAYDISAKLPTKADLILHAAEIEIDAVVYNGKEVEYRVSGDSLIIELPDTLSNTQHSELEITWQALNNYGLHKDRFGTVWSSLNPKTARYWMPVYDHPRVELSVNAAVTIPADLDIVFNGIKTTDVVTSADKKTVSWQVDTPIAVTGINFAVGDFVQLEAQSGIQKISISAQQNLVLEAELQNLLQTVAQVKKKMENFLSFEYPWNALHVVILEDGFWDVKSDAAGIVYANVNHGDLTTQIVRGIAAQWFGQYQREENEYSHQQIVEVIKNELIQEASLPVEYLNNEDALFYVDNWNRLVAGLIFKNPYYQDVIKQSIPDLIKEQRGVVAPNYYANYWYNKTGIPLYNVAFSTNKVENTVEKNISDISVDEAPYKLSLKYNEATSKALVSFKNNAGTSDELQSLMMHVHTFDDSTSQELTFTGKQDSVSITVPQSVEYITFSSASTNVDEVEFGRFPVMFLLIQLRSTNVEDRRLAAKLLRYHTDNPDLQLALKDVQDSETDEQTKANLLETLGAFTAGATGTNTQFMAQLNNENEAIQIAAIKALANYEEDESVPGLLQQKMERTNSKDVFLVAKNAFVKLADSARKISAMQRIISIDTTGNKSIQLLNGLVKADSSIQVNTSAEALLFGDFTYSIRQQALQVLLNIEHSADYWGNKIVELSSDADPRIRLAVLDALRYLPESDGENIKEALAMSENDPRVLSKLK